MLASALRFNPHSHMRLGPLSPITRLSALRFLSVLLLVAGVSVTACSAQEDEAASPESTHADVTEMDVRGEAGDYTFSVTVNSPDTGCEQYANWWEVVSADGTDLIYRRILAHPHTNQQPFTRSGGPVVIAPDSTVVVRAHMNDAGYGGQALRGTVDAGFSPVELPDEFGTEIGEASPDCGL